MTADSVTAISSDGAYLQFGIPGMPFSAVRIPLVEDLEEQDVWVARAMNAAQLLANAYHIAFAEPFPESPPTERYATNAEPQQRPRFRPATQPVQRANGNGQRAPQAPPAVTRGTGLFCPEHGVEVLKTSPRYDPEGDRYYHPLPPEQQYHLDDGRLVKNHNLYERQCVTEEALV